VRGCAELLRAQQVRARGSARSRTRRDRATGADHRSRRPRALPAAARQHATPARGAAVRRRPAAGADGASRRPVRGDLARAGARSARRVQRRRGGSPHVSRVARRDGGAIPDAVRVSSAARRTCARGGAGGREDAAPVPPALGEHPGAPRHACRGDGERPPSARRPGTFRWREPGGRLLVSGPSWSSPSYPQSPLMILSHLPGLAVGFHRVGPLALHLGVLLTVSGLLGLMTVLLAPTAPLGPQPPALPLPPASIPTPF